MPFDFKAYDAKCAGLDPSELQREWQHYTRLISGASTSTAVSGIAIPLTMGVSLIGIGMAAPAIHNARKKREIIEKHLQKQGATHNTRKRDVLGSMAFSGTIGVVTLGVGSMGADAIATTGAEHGISAIVENETAIKIVTHAALDGAGMGLEHMYTHHKKGREAEKAFQAAGVFQVVADAKAQEAGYAVAPYNQQGYNVGGSSSMAQAQPPYGFAYGTQMPPPPPYSATTAPAGFVPDSKSPVAYSQVPPQTYDYNSAAPVQQSYNLGPQGQGPPSYTTTNNNPSSVPPAELNAPVNYGQDQRGLVGSTSQNGPAQQQVMPSHDPSQTLQHQESSHTPSPPNTQSQELNQASGTQTSTYAAAFGGPSADYEYYYPTNNSMDSNPQSQEQTTQTQESKQQALSPPQVSEVPAPAGPARNSQPSYGAYSMTSMLESLPAAPAAPEQQQQQQQQHQAQPVHQHQQQTQDQPQHQQNHDQQYQSHQNFAAPTAQVGDQQQNHARSQSVSHWQQQQEYSVSPLTQSASTHVPETPALHAPTPTTPYNPASGLVGYGMQPTPSPEQAYQPPPQQNWQPSQPAAQQPIQQPAPVQHPPQEHQPAYSAYTNTANQQSGSTGYSVGMPPPPPPPGPSSYQTTSYAPAIPYQNSTSTPYFHPPPQSSSTAGSAYPAVPVQSQPPNTQMSTSLPPPPPPPTTAPPPMQAYPYTLYAPASQPEQHHQQYYQQPEQQQHQQQNHPSDPQGQYQQYQQQQPQQSHPPPPPQNQYQPPPPQQNQHQAYQQQQLSGYPPTPLSPPATVPPAEQGYFPAPPTAQCPPPQTQPQQQQWNGQPQWQMPYTPAATPALQYPPPPPPPPPPQQGYFQQQQQV